MISKVIFVLLAIAAINCAPSCPYIVCDNELKDPACFDTNPYPYHVKKCKDGEACVMNACMPVTPKYNPGYKASKAGECTTGILVDGYCRGMEEGKECVAATSDSVFTDDFMYDPREIHGAVQMGVADTQNLCDVGLSCFNKKCVKVKKIGDECNGTDKPCQALSQCFKGKCVGLYTLKEGEETQGDLLCESMLADKNNKCVAVKDGPDTVWFADDAVVKDACKFNGKTLTRDAQCVVFSKDKAYSSYCKELREAPKFIAGLKKYAGIISQENKLYAGTDMLTDEQLFKLDTSTRREILDAIFYLPKITEAHIPDCFYRPSEIAYKHFFPSFGYGLSLGILSFLALALLFVL